MLSKGGLKMRRMCFDCLVSDFKIADEGAVVKRQTAPTEAFFTIMRALFPGVKKFRKPDMDLPAIYGSNGEKVWVKNFIYHRVNGPAVTYGEDRENGEDWLQYGMPHRIGAPAIIRPGGHVEWWVEGKPFEGELYRKTIRNIFVELMGDENLTKQELEKYPFAPVEDLVYSMKGWIKPVYFYGADIMADGHRQHYNGPLDWD
jgi:hypothetical protein